MQQAGRSDVADEFNFHSSGGWVNITFLYGLIGSREGHSRAGSCVLIPTCQFKYALYD